MRILTHRDFNVFICSGPVAVIHVDAEWDRYCDQVRAKMLTAEEDLHEFAAFGEIDCDTQGDLCKSLGVANVPCIAYFREGRLVVMRVGVNQDIRDQTELISVVAYS